MAGRVSTNSAASDLGMSLGSAAMVDPEALANDEERKKKMLLAQRTGMGLGGATYGNAAMTLFSGAN